MPKWLTILLLFCLFAVASWLIWFLLNPVDKPRPLPNNGETSFLPEDGVRGYIIRKENTIYFIPENELPVTSADREAWIQLAASSKHPTGYILFGAPIERNIQQLYTGNMVIIWYTHILKNIPAQIDVLKLINIYD